VLDGVWNDVRDLEGFEDECRQGRDLGFDGKTLVHPGQVEPCNAAFAPSEEEVEQARAILAAWEGADGAGVVVHEGKMVENLHVESARKVLATHEAVQARS
jgi:citrate lyase subunit beta/citryl-CoA lyase